MTFSSLMLHSFVLILLATGLQIALWFLTLLSNGESDWDKAEISINHLALKSSGFFFALNSALWISYLLYAYLVAATPAYFWLYASQGIGLCIFATITRHHYSTK